MSGIVVLGKEAGYQKGPSPMDLERLTKKEYCLSGIFFFLKRLQNIQQKADSVFNDFGISDNKFVDKSFLSFYRRLYHCQTRILLLYFPKSLFLFSVCFRV